MLDYFGYPYDRPEHLGHEYIIATYLVFDSNYKECLKKAGNFAVGQTVGTWVAVPGISSRMIECHQGRVVSFYAVDGEEPVFILRLAFPQINFAGSYAMMLTALVGNDVSTALRTKLIDLELLGAAGSYSGPRQSIQHLRDLTGVQDRPLVLNMIKPCVGFTPEEGSKLFFDVAKGGVDLIKDDELLGSPTYNPVEKRTAAYLKAAAKAYEYSGKHTVYMPNISGTPHQMRENTKAVIAAGGKACLVNFVFNGLDTLADFCDEFGNALFIMVHYAGAGVMENARGGIANNVLLGLLPRLAGAHAVMTMSPARNDSLALFEFYKTIQAQRLPIPGISPVVTGIGGGITPVNQEVLQQELGQDLIIGIGGAIQGHPMGTTIGAQTAMAAVSASAKGIALEEAAQNCLGLQEALKLWKMDMTEAG